ATYSGTVSVLRNQGDGTFAAAVNYAAGFSPRSLAVGDVDGDSDLDLAVTNLYSGTVSVLRNQGDGTFAAAVSYPVGAYPISVVEGDLDRDGFLDLAVANYGSPGTVSVLHNDGTWPAARAGTGWQDGLPSLSELGGPAWRSDTSSGLEPPLLLLGEAEGARAAAVGEGEKPVSFRRVPLPAVWADDAWVSRFGTDD